MRKYNFFRIIFLILFTPMILNCCKEDCIIDDNSNTNTDNSDNDENDDKGEEDKKTIKIIATSTLGESTNSRIIYEDLGNKIKYKWEDTDKITVCFKHEYDGVYNEWKDFSISSIKDNIAEFTGEFTEGELVNFPDENWKYMWALSPAAPRLEESHWSTSILCSAKEQEIIDGKNTLKAAYSTARAEYKKGEIIDFKFYPRMAAVSFNVTLPSDLNIENLKGVKINGKGIFSERVLNLEAPKEPYFEWKQGIEDNINISFSGKLPINSERCLSFLIFMFPSENIESMNISIFDGNNKTYTTDIKSIQRLEAGIKYDTNVKFKEGISAEIESQKLNIASLFDNNGKFLSRYVLDLDNNKIEAIYFDDNQLKREERNITTSNNQISFENININSNVKFNGFKYDNQNIIITGEGTTSCQLKSQNNIIEILSESNDMEWKTDATLANNYGERKESGDAKQIIKDEFTSNLYIEWIQFQPKRKRLYSSGITKHGDLVFNNECESLKDLSLNNYDVIKFSMGNILYSYGGNGKFPGFTDEENRKSEAPFMYMKKTMPTFVETWGNEQGLIVVQEKLKEENVTYFYFIKTNGDEWIKFKVLD